MRATLFGLAVVVATAGCVDEGLCPGGVHDGVVVLATDGWFFEGTRGTLYTSGRPDRVIPYSEPSPYLACTQIGAIVVRDRGVVVDSEHYPNLEALGAFGTLPIDEGVRVIDELAGFDGVTTFGGFVGDEGRASIGHISGFNSVEAVSGNIAAAATVSGFRALRSVGGTVNVRGYEGLASLVEVGGDLSAGTFTMEALDLPLLERVGGSLTVEFTSVSVLGFPSLRFVGGDFILYGNRSLVTWLGTAPRTEIMNDLLVTQSSATIGDGVFFDWLRDSEIRVHGTITICDNNGVAGECE